ncbi:MAG: 2-oxoglutarate dehydrogenase E1 component, partial [Sulfobacillus sp.]|nr:2-oxoglutarate dehydrogenase E1 component [Sulfobacillus sp.]
TLAFASILAEGTPIRLSGQDSERGTFSQRHLVLHDVDTNQKYTPLQHLPSARASFAVYNSPLSEAAVLGFEYGYNVEAPTVMTLWEAQFGDFANAAQVIIDQFLSAARAKWKERSGLVLLLPHGYEGQGPEHSSARLERYLQLAADNNMRIANCTTAAQYFHLLRQQSHLLRRDPRPLVIMTPKSLLRHPLAASSLHDLSHGRFQPVLEHEAAKEHPESIERVILLSGKVVVDVLTRLGGQVPEHVSIIRIEQLYPFPDGEIEAIFHCYPNLTDVVWLQEEPRNMGAWRYIQPRLEAHLPPGRALRYAGRPERAATAEGFPEMHEEEQGRIVQDALGESKVSTQGGHR